MLNYNFYKYSCTTSFIYFTPSSVSIRPIASLLFTTYPYPLNISPCKNFPTCSPDEFINPNTWKKANPRSGSILNIPFPISVMSTLFSELTMSPKKAQTFYSSSSIFICYVVKGGFTTESCERDITFLFIKKRLHMLCDGDAY